MKWLFSPANLAFYRVDGEAEVVDIPADCAEIPTQDAERILAELETGDRLLFASDEGQPFTVSRVVFSPSALRFFHVGINTAEAFPSDCVDVTQVHANAIQLELSKGRIIAAADNGQPMTVERPPEPYEVLRSRLLLVLRDHQDAEARKKFYDSIDAACAYAQDDTVPEFQHDGIAYTSWRARSRAAALTILAAVERGERPAPNPSDFVAALPPSPAAQ